MPCYEDPSLYRDRDKERERAKLRSLIDKRTNMLCRVMRLLEYREIRILEKFDKDIIDWWISHQEFDRR